MQGLAGLYGTRENKKLKQALAVLGIVLMFAEKLVESEFSCPCDPRLNGLVVALYFVVPALLTCFLMCFMLDLNKPGFTCNSKFVSGLLVSFIPALMWVSLLLFDGHFLTCLVTDWPGTYVTIEINGKQGNQNWCEPTNSSLTEDKLFKTQWWLGVSQIAGLGVLGLIVVGIVVYNGCRKCCCRSSFQKDMQRAKTQWVKAAGEPEAGEEDDPLLDD